MSIKEITETLGGREIADSKPESNLHQAWELSIGGKILILKRYGSFCFWNRLALEKDGREVYEIRLKQRERTRGDNDIRTEFFSGKISRVYAGDRLSFVEYLVTAAQKEGFPEEAGLVKQGFKRKFARRYEEELRQILTA